jgi:glutamine synthetase
MEPVPGYAAASWQKGYGDFVMKPDISTLRHVPWLENTALVLCDVLDHHHHDLPHSPRAILKAQVARLAERKMRAYLASELEFYLFDESFEAAHAKRYHDLKTAGYYIEDYHIFQTTKEEGVMRALRKQLTASGIPVENSKGEWGLGQHEVNVRYGPVLEMADNHALFKQCLKEIADQVGVSVTFMAKYKHGQAGSSCHLHLSLRRRGKNVFAGKRKLGPVEGSDTFRWFLGGWIAHAPEFMVFYAPTVNSYKRYEDMSWAPTRLAWSHDNRTAGFRVVGHGESLRIECRIPGADTNPYLAFAAALASGLNGIEEKTEPPALFDGDVYAARNLPRVPYTLEHAVDLFEGSEFVKRVLGEDVAGHYAHFYRSEHRAYDRVVTDWERQRYFEKI